MITRVFCVRDNKLGQFHAPFLSQSEVIASRTLCIAFNDDQIQLSHFAGEYDLVELGTFNDQSGKYENLESPKFIASGTSLKALLAKENNTNEQK